MTDEAVKASMLQSLELRARAAEANGLKATARFWWEYHQAIEAKPAAEIICSRDSND